MSNVFETCLKGFKLIVVEPKMAQPVELNEESIDLFSSIGREGAKPSLSSKILVQPIEVGPQSVKGRSRSNNHPPIR